MHWFADALELQDSLAGIRVGAGHVLIDFLRDENLASSGEVLEARADIDHVAHHGVVLAVIGTNQRRIRHTGSNAHPDPKQVSAAQFGVDFGNGKLNLGGGGHSIGHMVLMTNRYVEESKDSIAPEIVQYAVTGDHDFAAPPEELIYQGSDHLGPQLVSQPGKVSTVREYYRYVGEVTHLPVDVSDDADVGVLDTPIDSKQPPDPTPETGKVHLPVK